MPKIPPAARPAIIDVRLKAPATLFVCSECDRGRQRRRELQSALKTAGRKREIRIVACRCLDVCPKRATAAILARTGGVSRSTVIDDAADPDQALALLLT